ncbi:intermembrane transport protein PqiB [Aestuariicoccus sp. MJ-SS9]|uniref:PqiB family protein n=1 Tax=Aestuariicoccus sp. MJ-SS9 TaxID=3079855 RepID=UPI0029142A76|nr:MlaD family protein [Aestuariicoccus sp. MJ-SS9]MDU8913327.1 MlaD family protein [Aestuariicoccus sp. MJ-SS9]
MTDQNPPRPEILPPRRSPLRNLSLIWLVPLVALVISLGIAWQAWSDRGVLIEITFDNAAGVTPEETTVRYRDVRVGVVEAVEFTEDLGQVVVAARIDQTVAANLPQDARFWVVRPEVTASGISGLSTVLSGVFIEAAFEPQAGAAATVFDGLAKTPLVRPGTSGTRITLQAPDGSSLSSGAPIYFRGIEVGRIETPRLLESGSGVVADAFIEAPHDQRLTTATRFWDTSGFSFSFGAGGLDVSVDSLAALVRGGVAFDTVFSGGNAIEPGNVFNLFPSENAARDSVFNALDADAVQLTVQFNESVSGLEAGSPVLFRGVQVGVVNAIGAVIEERANGPEVRLRVTIAIDPQALGLPEDAGEAETIAFLGEEVQQGLRAVLSTRNIFSTALIIELANVPDAAPAELSVFGGEFPVLPSAPSDLPDVTATAEGLLQRINALPVEELMQQAISLMASIEAVAAADGTRQAPDALLALLEDARGVIGADEVQALPRDIGAAMADIRTLLEDLRTAQAATQLVEALDAAESAATAVTTATADVPALIDDLRALSAKTEALALEDLVSQAAAILATADTLLADPATQGLPASVTAALDEARAAITTLTADGGLVPNANAAVGDLRGVIDDLRTAQSVQKLTDALTAAETAAGDVSLAIEGVPQLVEDLRALTATANELELQSLADRATDLLDAADRLIDTDAARDLPRSLSAALDEARGALAELRQGGTVENTNATLASARAAAEAVATAADALPELSRRLEGLVLQAQGTLSDYGERSAFNRDTLDTLRELRKAAEAIAKLARTIERDPNSLLLGK